ncbi:MAG: serine hydrolase [Bacteroidales bacterium]
MRKYFLSTLSFLLICTLAQAQVTKEDVKFFDEECSRAFSTFKPVGLSVAVIRDGKLVYKNALGYADIQSGEKLTTAHNFNIASCSKAFTSACIGLLVEEGKLHWNDKVVDILPEFRLSDPWITNELTVTDLLCHRSGLKTFEGDLLWYGSDYSDSVIMHRMRYLPIEQEFRSSFGYQNLMYMVAGEVIKKVSGKTWEDFLQERLLSPLGMNHSAAVFGKLPKGLPLAMPHYDGKRIPITLFNSVKPAGAVFSNVEDLANWTSMLMNDGKLGEQIILKPNTLRQLFAAKTIIGVSTFNQQNGINFRAYGLGWFMFDFGGKKILEHDGGMPGYISKVMVIPSEKLAFVILNNSQDGYVNDALKFQLLTRFLKVEKKDWITEMAGFRKSNEEETKKEMDERIASRVPGTQPSLALAGYCGIFNDDTYGKAEVKLENDLLKLTLLPSAGILSGTLEHWHYNTFKVTFRDETLNFGLITFSLDAAGKVTGFKIDLPSGDFHFNDLDFKKQPE